MPVRKSKSEEAKLERKKFRDSYYTRSHDRKWVRDNVYKLLIERLNIPSMFCAVEHMEDDNIKILVPKEFKSRVKKTINDVHWVPTETVVDAIILTEIEEWKNLK